MFLRNKISYHLIISVICSSEEIRIHLGLAIYEEDNIKLYLRPL